MSIFATIKSWFVTAISEIDDDIQPGIKYIEENIPAIAIQIGEALLAGVEVGTPYAVIVKTLITTLQTQGVKLVSGAAHVVLNTAESNLIAAGTPAPITVANIEATAVATPLPSTTPAVIAASAIIPAAIIEATPAA